MVKRKEVMKNHKEEIYETPEPQMFTLTTVPHYFREDDDVILKNNFIYDLVNMKEHSETVNETYPERKGKVTGIYFNILKNRYFYGVCPNGKDKEEPGSNEYYFEETLIYNMKDLLFETISEEQKRLIKDIQIKFFDFQENAESKKKYEPNT